MALPGHHDTTLTRVRQAGCQAVPQVIEDVQLMQLWKLGLIESRSIEWQTPIIAMLEGRIHLTFVDIRKAYRRKVLYLCVCHTKRYVLVKLSQLSG